jgi:hypothetical protein
VRARKLISGVLQIDPNFGDARSYRPKWPIEAEMNNVHVLL